MMMVMAVEVMMMAAVIILRTNYTQALWLRALHVSFP